MKLRRNKSGKIFDLLFFFRYESLDKVWKKEVSKLVPGSWGLDRMVVVQFLKILRSSFTKKAKDHGVLSLADLSVCIAGGVLILGMIFDPIHFFYQINHHKLHPHSRHFAIPVHFLNPQLSSIFSMESRLIYS